MIGLSALSIGLPGIVQAGPRQPHPALITLRRELEALIGDREVAVDIRRMDTVTGHTYYRAQVKAEELYPVASCFKTWAALYYFTHMPADAWNYAEGSPVYNMLVSSSNNDTSTVLDTVGRQVRGYGNAIQKFNDFLLFTLHFDNGLYSWNWPGTVTAGQIDDRFAPSWSHYVEFHGQRYDMNNIMTAREMADGYTLFFQPGYMAEDAFRLTHDLLGIPGRRYRAPLERVFAQGYTGKDGVLPAADSTVGYVMNDAGIVQIGDGTYIIAYMCIGENEPAALETLRTIAGLIEQFEAAL
ncbi:MAG: hypothetical protein OHK0046_28280 [Anaerolineae bacterium]